MLIIKIAMILAMAMCIAIVINHINNNNPPRYGI